MKVATVDEVVVYEDGRTSDEIREVTTDNGKVPEVKNDNCKEGVVVTSDDCKAVVW